MNFKTVGNRRLKKSILATALMGAVALLAASTFAATTPSVSVGTVTNSPNPVCSGNNTGNVSISAPVTPTYDGSTGPTTSDTCQNGSSTSTETITVTTTGPISEAVTASASDGTNNTLPATDASAGFSGSLPVGPEGKTTVTVSATASDQIQTCTTTTVKTWSAKKCQNGTGTVTSTTGPTTSCAAGSTRSGGGSNSSSYLVDLIGPSYDPQTKINPSIIMQTQSEHVNVQLDDGSAGTPFSITATATQTLDGGGNPPGIPAILSFTDSGLTFHTSSDGIDKEKSVPFSMDTKCDTPTGTYDMMLHTATVDLCGGDNSPADIDLGTFSVTPGVSLSAQTVVVSEFASGPLAGDYGLSECFTTANGNPTPGTVHVTSTLTTSGPCANFGTISGVSDTINLDPGFSFTLSGNSPVAHVYMGVAPGFDFKTGAPLVEVTGEVKQLPAKKLTSSTTFQTLDLSKVNLDDFPALVTANGGPFGLGPGVFPSNFTIFATAHARYNGTNPTNPPPAGPTDVIYTFSSSANATSSSGDALTGNTSSATVDGNPTDQLCVDGGFAPLP